MDAPVIQTQLGQVTLDGRQLMQLSGNRARAALAALAAAALEQDFGHIQTEFTARSRMDTQVDIIQAGHFAARGA